MMVYTLNDNSGIGIKMCGAFTGLACCWQASAMGIDHHGYGFLFMALELKYVNKHA